MRDENVLFFLDRHAQAQWTCYNNVGSVKFSEQTNTLSRQFQAHSEVVVYVSLKGLDVVGGIRIRFRRGKLVRDSLWKSKLLSKSGYILYLEGRRRCVSDQGF